jgi:DNA polymerase-1
MQTYIKFGIRPYDRDIKKYLEGDDEGFNQVEEIPLEKLLTYCGRDSMYGKLLEIKQRKELKTQRLMTPYKFLHASAIIMGELHQNGICADEEYFDSQDKILGEQIETLEKGLLSTPEAIKFKKETGKIVDLASSKDLGILFYDVLKLPVKKTTKGNRSVDKNTLDKMDLPFVKDLLRMRKLDKAKGTYLAQFKREIINGKLNPFFTLGNVVSYRSGSNSPNLQNIPTRDDEVKKMIRSGIKASPGNVLFFFDFSGAEVRTSVCTHKDPNMIKYITDPTTDMHRDTGMDIFILSLEEVTKDIRFYAKNQWVFAQFYGSYWKDCGENLWLECIERLNLPTKSGKSLRDHLKEHGIETKAQFLNHCKEVEEIFWGERFKIYAEWKKEINSEYQRRGYIETFFGFRFQGYMDRKQVSNYPIQGQSFHILLWCIQQIKKIAAKEKWKSEMVGQIHDELIFDAPPEEVPRIAEVVKDIVHNQLREAFDWIIVPFEVEFSITPIGGSWYEKQDYVG